MHQNERVAAAGRVVRDGDVAQGGGKRTGFNGRAAPVALLPLKVELSIVSKGVAPKLSIGAVRTSGIAGKRAILHDQAAELQMLPPLVEPGVRAWPPLRVRCQGQRRAAPDGEVPSLCIRIDRQGDAGRSGWT